MVSPAFSHCRSYTVTSASEFTLSAGLVPTKCFLRFQSVVPPRAQETYQDYTNSPSSVSGSNTHLCTRAMPCHAHMLCRPDPPMPPYPSFQASDRYKQSCELAAAAAVAAVEQHQQRVQIGSHADSTVIYTTAGCLHLPRMEVRRFEGKQRRRYRQQ